MHEKSYPAGQINQTCEPFMLLLLLFTKSIYNINYNLNYISIISM